MRQRTPPTVQSAKSEEPMGMEAEDPTLAPTQLQSTPDPQRDWETPEAKAGYGSPTQGDTPNPTATVPPTFGPPAPHEATPAPKDSGVAVTNPHHQVENQAQLTTTWGEAIAKATPEDDWLASRKGGMGTAEKPERPARPAR